MGRAFKFIGLGLAIIIGHGAGSILGCAVGLSVARLMIVGETVTSLLFIYSGMAFGVLGAVGLFYLTNKIMVLQGF